MKRTIIQGSYDVKVVKQRAVFCSVAIERGRRGGATTHKSLGQTTHRVLASQRHSSQPHRNHLAFDRSYVNRYTTVTRKASTLRWAFSPKAANIIVLRASLGKLDKY
jgi:hypothetical protein